MLGSTQATSKALGYFQRLLDLEDQYRGLSDDERRRQRDLRSCPLLEEMKAWFDEQLLALRPRHETARSVSTIGNWWRNTAGPGNSTTSRRTGLKRTTWRHNTQKRWASFRPNMSSGRNEPWLSRGQSKQENEQHKKGCYSVLLLINSFAWAPYRFMPLNLLWECLACDSDT